MSDQLVERLLQSAQQPCEGELLLGFRHYLGIDTPQDYAHALRHFTAAAQQGSPSSAWAEYAIGLMHESGTGVPRSLMQADAWYRRAARRGNIPALCALGEVREAMADRPLEALELLRRAEQAARLGVCAADDSAAVFGRPE